MGTNRLKPADFGSMEKAWETNLPRQSFSVIRVDGKGFSKFTKKMRKDAPFSQEFSNRMVRAAHALTREIPGVSLAFTQSDEISILVHDFGEDNEKAYSGRVQKLSSIAASVATAHFNLGTMDTACFDGRVIDLGASEDRVAEYFKSRYSNGISNSLGMLCSYYYSHKSLIGMGTMERKERLRGDGFGWDETVSPMHRYGIFLAKVSEMKEVSYTRRDSGITVSTVVQRRAWREFILSDFSDFKNFNLR